MAKNIIKTVPEIGDAVIIIDGKKRFVRGEDATSEFLNSHTCIGVVYDVQGTLVRIVGGVNNQSKQWSCVADYEITAIPNASGDYAVTLMGVNVGNFTYTKNTGTIAEFTTQLNTWLGLNTHEEATKFEAYTRGEHSYLQLSDYTAYESTISIANTTLVKLMGSEIADYTISTGGRNHVKQFAVYNGMNRVRLEEYVSGRSTDANCNPTTRMDGITQLFTTFPVCRAYYEGELGDGLRANFATYSDYLDACMVISEDLDKGVMKFRDGKLMTSLLKDKTVLKGGTETYAYTAARYAYDYDAGVLGFRAGSWWLPSMYELSKVMRVAQKLNRTLSKKSGWSSISVNSIRWSVSRYSSGNAWVYSNGGITNGSDFSYSLSVSCVSAFYLDD